MPNTMRDAAKERFWRGALMRFAASRLSVRAFCRRESLAESAFYAWRRTIAERDIQVRRPAGAKQSNPVKARRASTELQSGDPISQFGVLAASWSTAHSQPSVLGP